MLYDNVGEYTEEERRLMATVNKLKPINCFEHEGRIYLGVNVEAAKEFCKNTNYPADLSVWLQDNYRELK